MPPAARLAFLRALQSDFHSIETKLARLSLRAASAFSKSDLVQIMQAVEALPGGVQALDVTVHALLRDWLATAAAAELAERPHDLALGNNVGNLLVQLGRLAEAIALYRAALAEQARTRGAQHAQTLGSVHNLASALAIVGSSQAEAEALFRRALDGRERTLGPAHADTLSTASGLGSLLAARARSEPALLDEAEALCRRALNGREHTLGAAHADTLSSANNVAIVLARRGKLAEAEQLYRRALLGRVAALGSDHPDTLSTRHNLALLLEASGRPDEAEPLLRAVVQAHERVLGRAHPTTLEGVHSLAHLLAAIGGNEAEAEALARRALDGRTCALGAQHEDTASSGALLAAVRRGTVRASPAALQNEEAVGPSEREPPPLREPAFLSREMRRQASSLFAL